MKGTVALSWDNRVVVSPHIGEMDSPRSLDVFEQVASDLQALYGVRATRVVCDAHPGYTTQPLGAATLGTTGRDRLAPRGACQCRGRRIRE